MCGIICSVITIVVGGVLVVGSCLISFMVVPSLIENLIKNEVTLLNDTVQYERFEQVPFPLKFSLRVMTISNPEEVLAGQVPIIVEKGPYVYNCYQSRNITYANEDIMRYFRMERFEFDGMASHPLTEDDTVTVINVAYHAIIQIAAQQFPTLVSVLNIAMGSVFGEYNSPIATFKIRDLFFDGVPLCKNPGTIGMFACTLIRQIGASAQNLEAQPDGSIRFSLLAYKNNKPSPEYEIHRGFEDSDQLGLVRSFNGYPHFFYWVDEQEDQPSVCNMINGTDSGIFAPFIDREKSIYAMNTDVCRSVELRYQYDTDVDGIPVVKYSANEWFMDNNEGCFCLNVTSGITRDDGCLLSGVMELYTCVGAKLVLSYPHFLYADLQYRNGVLGMTPDEEKHRIFINLEPRTGTPVQGAKRAQFNIFQRPISGIPPTANLRTLLMPIVWIEESVDMPEEYLIMLRTELVGPLNLVDIVIPVLISLCVLVLLIGLVLLWRAKRNTAASAQPVMETAAKN